MTADRWAAGLSREEAAALGREISATPGYYGELHRLAGQPEPAGWGVRVRDVTTGQEGLVRSRAAWLAYQQRPARDSASEQQKEGANVEALQRQTARAAARAKHLPDPMASAVAAGTDALKAGMAAGHSVPPGVNGTTFTPPRPTDLPAPPAPMEVPTEPPEPKGRASAGPTLEDCRALLVQAIAQAEAEAPRLRSQADRLRERSVRLLQDAKRLRRALLLVDPSATGEGPPGTTLAQGPAARPRGESSPGPTTIQGRVLAWAQTHGGELQTSAAAAGLGLVSKRVWDATSHLCKEGVVERVGKGHYRLTGEEQAR